MDNYYKGFVYTRNPINGKNELYGKITKNYENYYVEETILEESFESILKELNPNIYEAIYSVCKKIEQHFKEMQYIEFEILNDKVFITSSITGKRTAIAASKIASDLVNEGICTDKKINVDDVAFDNPIQKYFLYLDSQICNKEFDENKLLDKNKTYNKYTKNNIKNDNKFNKNFINKNTTYLPVKKLTKKGK